MPNNKSNPKLDPTVVAMAKQAMSVRLNIAKDKLAYIGAMDNRPYGGKKCIALFNVPDGRTLAEDVANA